MNKKILLFVIASLTVFCLFSCKINVGDDPANVGDGSISDNTNGTTSNENFVWSSGVAPKILLDSYSSKNLDVTLWSSKFYELTGVAPSIIEQDSQSTHHEIMVGRVERTLSQKAYNQLEEFLGSKGEDEGWLIYSDGKSLAIAYSDQFSFIEAIEYFYANMLSENSFAPQKGVLAEESFDVNDYVTSIRNERREKELDALIPKIGEESVEALKSLFSIYGTNLYLWMTDLYDTEIGGFYFSNSARNTETFLPDIESTAQMLDFIARSGLVEGSLKDAIPEEISQQILNFAKSLQSSQDGYFYHPQWGTNIPDSRRGRDLGWATSTIARFDGKPLYDTPSGVEGELGAPGKIESVSHLTSRLDCSKVVAVSKVVPASNSNLPSYLKSIGAWKTYIDELNIPYSSYNGGSTLDAQNDLIKSAGKEYIDYLFGYLNNIQNPQNGLFEAADSDNNEYYAVNGLMKISALYNFFEKEIPNATAAAESCMAVLLKPDGDVNVVSTYNPWITLNYILTSVKRSDEAKGNELRATILTQAPDLITSTLQKIAKYRMMDGAFAYLGEQPPANISTGVLVGCATGPESDVNATSISSVGIVSNIFKVLGCEEVKLYGDADWLLMKEYWLSLGELVKVPYADDIIPISFDDYNESNVEIDSGVVLEPVEHVYNTVGDTESENGIYKWFNSSVVKNPKLPAGNDLVLKCESFLNTGAAKDKASTASKTGFELQGITYNKNCYVFEGNMYFKVNEGSMCVGQIMFTSSLKSGGSPSFSLNVYKYTANGKTYLSIGENYEGLDGVKNEKIASGIPTEEWVKLRIEVYKYTENDELQIRGKVYVNGEYKGTCDAGYTKNGEFKNYGIAGVEYYHYRHSAGITYFNDIAVYAISKDYVDEDDYTGEPQGPKEIGFEDYMTYGETSYLHTSTPKSPDASYGVTTVIGADGKETKAYVYDSNVGGEDIFRLQSYGIDVDNKLTSANAFTYKADMKFDFNTDAQNCQVKLQLGSTGSTSYHAYYMLISIDKESGKLKLNDVGAKKNGSTVITEVNNGEWFNIRLEYYYISDAEMLALTYINNKLVYVSNNYNCENSRDSSVWPVFRTDKYTLPSGSQVGGGIEKIMFTTLTNTDVTIYLDNCITRRVELEVPEIDDEDYTSRSDADISEDDDGNENTPSNPGGGNTGGGTGEGGENKPNENEPGQGTVTPPSQSEIVDNLPDGTWKK